ncbi:hypothetical protein GGS20DRAFT_7913 [Poronia punctata]|nr:hypothetical protein GGS20DRAFT_7913 [Poronia punctata]
MLAVCVKTRVCVYVLLLVPSNAGSYHGCYYWCRLDIGNKSRHRLRRCRQFLLIIGRLRYHWRFYMANLVWHLSVQIGPSCWTRGHVKK